MRMESSSLVHKVVRCLRNVEFIGGTQHIEGKKYVITAEEVSYFWFFLNKDYELV